MKNHNDRVLLHARLYLKRDATLRSVASKTGYCKQTILNDFRDRLPNINFPLYEKVCEKINENIILGSLKGGIKTQEIKAKRRLRNV